MANYATDNDMIRYCAQIATALPVGDFASQHEEAARVIDRDLFRGWYRRRAEELGIDWEDVAFDRAKIESIEELAALGAFKALELAGEMLSQNPGTSDARDQWQEIRDHFRARYDQELADVLEAGIAYDFSAGDDLRSRRVPRRLGRC